MLNNKVILVTGGTGSFGNAFVRIILKNYKPRKIIIFSRDEMKQWDMSQKFNHDKRLRFFLGDVRDKDRLLRAFDNVDYVIHAAATKIITSAEYNPFEAVKTNVIGAMNIIDAAIDKKIKKVVALSTDKASNPINLYGATKLASDKLFIAGNAYSGEHDTTFSIVRYGNVMGSRGSVIPFFLSLKDQDYLPITDKRMTRFMITLEQGVDLVLTTLSNMQGGEIFVKKIPSMNIVDIAKAINPFAKLKITGIRPGEKLHEQMIGIEDSPWTFDYGDYYKIIPSIYNSGKDQKRTQGGKKVNEGFIYSSEVNTDWMDINFLMNWIKRNKEKVGIL